MVLSSWWRRALAACVEMDPLATKLHLCDIVNMNIYREIVNVCGMRKVNTVKRNWNSKLRICLDILACSGRSRVSLSCSGWCLHCDRQRGHLWTHGGSDFILCSLWGGPNLSSLRSLDASPMATEPRLLERSIQGLKWLKVILSLNGMQMRFLAFHQLLSLGK